MNTKGFMKRIYGDDIDKKLKETKADKKALKRDVKILKRFLCYLLPYWYRWAIGFICMLISTLLSLPGPFITKIIIDSAIPHRNLSLLILLALTGVALFVFWQIIDFIQKWLFLTTGQKIMLDIRLEFYEHLQRLPLKFYHDTKTGDIMSRILNDISSVEGLLGGTFLQILQDSMTLIAGVVVVSFLNWQLALIALAMLPFSILSFMYFKKRFRVFSKLSQENKAEVFSILQERISGTMLIKSFAREKTEAINFVRSFRKIINLTIRQTVFGSISGFANGFINTLVPAMITFYGGMQIMQGNLTIGSLIAFLGYIRYIYGPIQRLLDVNMGIQTSLAALERVVDILEMEPEEITNNKVKPRKVDGEIRFENVCFSYVNGRGILFGINLKVHSGTILGVVGPSGAGKTSLLNLVPRFYSPQEGFIYLDGKDIKDIKLKSLRRNIGIVSQEVFLFSGSLKDNIAYANPRASIDDIMRATQMAQIHEFIMSLPEGYDTQVGEKGAKLSGGQKQRVAIARMILSDPTIVLLDEATSFLDTQTESLMMDSLEPWLRTRTVIMVAHRLSSLKNVDRIILLNSGKVVVEGTHAELYSTNKLYKQLYDKQIIKEF